MTDTPVWPEAGAKKPDWISEGEGFYDVTLSRPAEFGGVKIDVLRMREPTVDDTIIASEMKGSDAHREVTAIASLCMQAPVDIRKLPLKDFKRLQTAYTAFIV
jgi:hypothetical protein